MNSNLSQMFYVYCHCRPDGSPFYIGKGKGRRAKSLSSRSPWHRNVVKKYGAENIIIEVQECESEQEAFFREKLIISSLRGAGARLINLTDGGEGTSGWNHSESTIEKIRKSNSGERNAGSKRRGKRKPHSEKTKEEIKQKTLEQFADEGALLRHSLLTKEMWNDPVYVAKQMESRRKRDYTSVMESARMMSSYKFKCAECEFVNNAGNVAHHHKATGHKGRFKSESPPDF